MMLIGLGAGCGAVLRYLITMAGKQWGQVFPLATLVINATGAFIAGVLAALVLPQAWSLLLLTGFCGGYTTFSTYMTDTFVLLRDRHWARGLLYYLGTAVLGILAAVAGALVGHMI
ncbi:fluoride efflux transporter CrcB [Secundilactobacillus yichangensis]|uniref:fluoride efflux transporter CrcB n=1 Tax=Secundilactobacillus yichangensis TaxID=2799580 RepID=UPI00194549AA|nr:fluoride efflux transporter CrcB [Secundilactobacillus yichangensis]